jgi:hypothetical protein
VAQIAFGERSERKPAAGKGEADFCVLCCLPSYSNPGSASSRMKKNG